MNVSHIRDRELISTFLRKDTPVHIYAIGDLDAPYWQHTTWYAAKEGDEVKAICLLFSQFSPPVLLAICEPGSAAMQALLAEIGPQLPDRLYAHISPGVESAVETHYRMELPREHLKMYLADRSRLDSINTSRVVGLEEDAADALEAFYPAAYNDTVEGSQVFDRSMLTAGQYFGIWEGEQLVSAAGVHVFSPEQGVAAVANIATLPDFRGRGFATATTALLCRSLLSHVRHIGLNVRADNAPAIRCYNNLGFETVARYFECGLTRDAPRASG